jgi:hypothetical protein
MHGLQRTLRARDVQRRAFPKRLFNTKTSNARVSDKDNTQTMMHAFSVTVVLLCLVVASQCGCVWGVGCLGPTGSPVGEGYSVLCVCVCVSVYCACGHLYLDVHPRIILCTLEYT